jgi:hypothetical protein
MRKLIRYTLKPESVAENERYVRSVFDELRRAAPADLRYAVFKLDDGVSFMHLVAHEKPDGNKPLTDLPAFKAFTAKIRERCVAPPVSVEVEEIGSYGFFDT